jgi:hypothetical protein
VSVHKKGEKTGPTAGVPPPALKTVVGVPGLPVYPARGRDIEELSESFLIDELPSSPGVAATTPTPPEEPEPITVAPPRVEAPPKPAPGRQLRNKLLRAASILLGWRESQRAAPGGRRLVTIAFAGLAAGVGSVLLVVTAFRYHRAESRVSAGGAASHSARPALPSKTLAGPTPAPVAIPACAVAGEPRIVAPTAMLAAGIEVRGFGDDVALGFSSNEHEATVVRLDPSSLATSESTVSHAAFPIRHATPIPGRGGRLGLAIDVDRPGDPLQGRRTLPIDPPLQIGVAGDGSLSWAPTERGIQGRLWPMDGPSDAPVEALRGARSESNLAEVAIAFRRRDSVWVGTAERANTLTPRGELSRIAGLGSTVGSPAVAIDEGVVVAAWADRPTAEDRWQLRWTRFRAGDAPPAPSTFTPPPGGKGQEVMSPGLSVVPGQRFLLVWTEGLPKDHQVRALTLSANGAAVGAPLNISSAGVNAGQGQAAVAASGRGVVAFLESFGSGFRVAVTPIACSH